MNEISFKGVNSLYGWMGNMYNSPITYDGLIWRTSEALFQSLRFDDPIIKEIIRNERSPMSAKMKSKKFKEHYVIVPMSEKDVMNMKTCVALKFKQNQILRGKLIETNDQLIYEDIGNRKKERDFFWGAKLINGSWIGNNMMGRILMELRCDLN